MGILLIVRKCLHVNTLGRKIKRRQETNEERWKGEEEKEMIEKKRKKEKKERALPSPLKNCNISGIYVIVNSTCGKLLLNARMVNVFQIKLIIPPPPATPAFHHWFLKS